MASLTWSKIWRGLALVTAVCILVGIAALGFATYKYLELAAEVPDHTKLQQYAPPVTTRVHAGDGTLIAEFARERRLFVPFQGIPDEVVRAFISAEDKNFFEHSGVDLTGIVRATIANVRAKLEGGGRLEGASTITQQVAKNFLLSSERSIERKVKEWILAVRIEKALSKDKILELYLNEIYLGLSSYGVAAAALNYFDKALSELTVGEVAYLAALPKAPNNYHPVRRKDRAIARRDWVIDRMVANGYLDAAEGDLAKQEDLVVKPRPIGIIVPETGYFAEEVRRSIVDLYGDEAVYQGGLSVRTSVEPRLQAIALDALRDGLVGYDRKYGWRGPAAKVPADQIAAGDFSKAFEGLSVPSDIVSWRIGVVLSVGSEAAEIGLEDGMSKGKIPLAELAWARKSLPDGNVGPEVRSPKDVLAVGDIVYVERVSGDWPGVYKLHQMPEVNGAVAALDPHTGRVLALVGGFSFEASEFNRATQARRQPGSAFKTFVYAAALENGMTPSTLVLDAPFVIDQGPGLGLWKPDNYTDRFYGPSTLRLGLEKSRNVMTVRMAQEIGMDRVVGLARRFGINEDMLPVLSMALGAGETTLLKLTNAYGMIVNGGRKVDPILIDYIQDQTGVTKIRADQRTCPECRPPEWDHQLEPQLIDNREQVIDERTAYQVTSMLQGVVTRGTAASLSSLGLTIAGKTGTTNEERDAWFIGFSPDLVCGVFVGYDNPRHLGTRETGGSLAAPIFGAFMQKALEGVPQTPFRTPPGIRLVSVDKTSGLPTDPGAPNSILEAFKVGTEPTSASVSVVGGSEVYFTTGKTGGAGSTTIELGAGTGGLY